MNVDVGEARRITAELGEAALVDALVAIGTTAGKWRVVNVPDDSNGLVKTHEGRSRESFLQKSPITLHWYHTENLYFWKSAKIEMKS